MRLACRGDYLAGVFLLAIRPWSQPGREPNSTDTRHASGHRRVPPQRLPQI